MLQRLAIVCLLVVPGMTTNPPASNASDNIWERSGKFEGDIMLGDGNSRRNVLRYVRWPGGIVPYEIDRRFFSDQDVWVIQRSMQIIEYVVASRGIDDGTCTLRFVPRTEQHRNYIYIFSQGPGICWSWIGFKGGIQNLSLGSGCVSSDIVVHELLHALGFAHQHTDPYRDNFLYIIKENIEPGKEYNFELKSPDYYTDYNLGYDFKSIMHYSPYAFAKRGPDGSFVGPTMVAKDKRIHLGRNMVMSKIDKMKLLIMYCKDHVQFPKITNHP